MIVFIPYPQSACFSNKVKKGQKSGPKPEIPVFGQKTRVFSDEIGAPKKGALDGKNENTENPKPPKRRFWKSEYGFGAPTHF